MANLITNIGTVMTGIIGWFGDVSTALIANEVFQLILAVVLFVALVTLLVNLVGKIKARQTRR